MSTTATTTKTPSPAHSNNNVSKTPKHNQQHFKIKVRLLGEEDTSSSSSTSTEIELFVNNVVCSYSTKCYLNLRRIATEGLHVEEKKANSMVLMRLRKPLTTASIWSSGKCTCTGATTELDAYKAARRYCRQLQRMKFKVRLANYRVVNVLATCSVPFGVDIYGLAQKYQKECSYEPELHPGATFKLKECQATLKIFTTGSVTLTARSVQRAEQAVQAIYPILHEFRRCCANEATTNGASSQNKQLPSAVLKQEQSVVNFNMNGNMNSFSTSCSREMKMESSYNNFYQSSFNHSNILNCAPSSQHHLNHQVHSNTTSNQPQNLQQQNHLLPTSHHFHYDDHFSFNHHNTHSNNQYNCNTTTQSNSSNGPAVSNSMSLFLDGNNSTACSLNSTSNSSLGYDFGSSTSSTFGNQLNSNNHFGHHLMPSSAANSGHLFASINSSGAAVGAGGSSVGGGGPPGVSQPTVYHTPWFNENVLVDNMFETDFLP